MGVAWRDGLDGLEQFALCRKGQLLFGGVPGDRRAGMDGTGWQQQLSNIGSLLGQLRERHCARLTVIWDNAPAYFGEASEGVPADAGSEHCGCLTCRVTVRTSMPTRQSGAGPGRRRSLNLCLTTPGQGAKAGRQLPRWSGQPERGGHQRRCRTVLQSRASVLPRDSH